MKMTPINPESLTADVMARFWSHTGKGDNGCINWVGGASSAGYGRFNVDGRFLGPHRIAVVAATLCDIPEGHVVDHLCRNPRCVNAAHLDVVTFGENTARGMSPRALATKRILELRECKRGHDLNERGFTGTDGRRRCRECGLERHRSLSADPAYREAQKLRAREARASGRWRAASVTS